MNAAPDAKNSVSLLVTVPKIDAVDWQHLRHDLQGFLETYWFEIGTVTIDDVQQIKKRNLRQWEGPPEPESLMTRTWTSFERPPS